MGRPRRKFTTEFKLEAVRLLLQSGQSQSRIASDLGISAALLGRWKDKFTADLTADNGETEQEELRRLRSEVAVLREERAILKKAAAFFAKESK